MKTILLLVGKTQNKNFQAGISDYSERITHYMPFEIKVIPELKNTRNLNEEQQKVREGELILKELQPADTVVLMDEHGKELRSIELARWLQGETEHLATTCLCNWRAIRLFARCVCKGKRTAQPFKNDVQPSDGAPYHG